MEGDQTPQNQEQDGREDSSLDGKQNSDLAKVPMEWRTERRSKANKWFEEQRDLLIRCLFVGPTQRGLCGQIWNACRAFMNHIPILVNVL